MPTASQVPEETHDTPKRAAAPATSTGAPGVPLVIGITTPRPFWSLPTARQEVGEAHESESREIEAGAACPAVSTPKAGPGVIVATAPLPAISEPTAKHADPLGQATPPSMLVPRTSPGVPAVPLVIATTLPDSEVPVPTA
jgi:hypothetical protein